LDRKWAQKAHPTSKKSDWIGLDLSVTEEGRSKKEETTKITPLFMFLPSSFYLLPFFRKSLISMIISVISRFILSRHGQSRRHFLWSTTAGSWFCPSGSVIPIWLHACWLYVSNGSTPIGRSAGGILWLWWKAMSMKANRQPNRHFGARSNQAAPRFFSP
jgi:hypothetical protein